MDLDAQRAALDVALADVSERIDEAQAAVKAILAARREADVRLSELKRSLVTAPSADPLRRTAQSQQDKALSSLEAIARITGVPSGPVQASEMDELERLHRLQNVGDRLAALKARRSS